MKSQLISEDIIQQIQESVDIVHLVSGYVSLKKSGQNYVGLCPFHSEKTPSFTVNITKQIFHCFGCGTGGSVFKFFMLKEGVSFPEAVRELGKMAGISVPLEGGGSLEEERDLLQVNEAAREYFHGTLLKDPSAEPARLYLKKREIMPETIRDFSIGFALPGRTHCLRVLERKGFTSDQLEKAGLAGRRSSGEGYYDRFSGRLMFPVFNLKGRCIAFGGRVLDDSLPKYLNSPETPLYHKGKTLFAIDKFEDEKGTVDSLILMEGYFDAVRAFQSGIRNVAATCGTALTPFHLQMIRRRVRKVYLMFDPDQAGIKAALRTIDLFLESGIAARVVVLPGGLDPDLFLKTHGKEAFDLELEKAVPLFDFVLKSSLQKHPGSDIEEKLEVLKEILPLIHKISNSVERSYYINRVAADLSVSENDLWRELSRIQKKILPDSRVEPSIKKPESLPLEEEYVIRFLLAGKAAPAQIFKYVVPEDFSDPRLNKIMRVLFENNGTEEKINLQQFLSAFSGEHLLYELMTSLALKEPDYDYPIQALEESLERLIHRRLKQERLELEKKIPDAEKGKKFEEVAAISKMLLKIRTGLNERVKL